MKLNYGAKKEDSKKIIAFKRFKNNTLRHF